MTYRNIDEWRKDASLRFSVYMPFANWLRMTKDMSNDDIAFCSPAKMARYEEEYYRHMTATNWD